jgi:iron complex outermembrane receptor protein
VQRRVTRLEKTPVSVAVLGSKQLQDKAVHTESDLQSAVPGLLVRATLGGNQQNYAIRGQSIDAFTGSQPAVQSYIDEVPVTVLAASSFYDLSSVQAIKGPQGTLFGRNTTGGAVIFTTAQPSDTYSGYLDTRIGDYSLREVQGAVNFPIVPDKLSVRIAADGDWRDGYARNLYDNSTVGDVNRKGLRVSIKMKPTEDITNTLVVDYARVTRSAAANVLYHVTPVGATNGGSPANDTGTIFFSPLLDSVVGAGSCKIPRSQSRRLRAGCSGLSGVATAKGSLRCRPERPSLDK